MPESKIKTYLDRLAVSSLRPNSFLFVGSPEEEKYEAAHHFIQGMSGKAGESEFLRRVSEGAHPDIIVIEPETVENKKGATREKEITVAQVRAAQERLKYFPYELKQKFCLIKKAERMNQEASNALLKILEEPTASTFFILFAVNSESLLPTIISRCATVRFVETDLPVWNESYREALRKTFVDDIPEKFEFAEKISKDKKEAIDILRDWEIVMSEGLRKMITRAGGTNLGQIQKTIEILGKNRETLNRIEHSNANLRAALEGLMLEVQWK